MTAPALALSGASDSSKRQSSQRTWLSSHHTPSPAVMPSLQFFDQFKSRRRRSGSRTTTSSASGPSARTHLAFFAAARLELVEELQGRHHRRGGGVVGR